MVIVVAIFITIITGSGNQFLESHKLLERDRARQNNSKKESKNTNTGKKCSMWATNDGDYWKI